LREEFPGKEIPHVPAKNRSWTTARSAVPSTIKDNGGNSDAGSRTSSESSGTASAPSSPSSPNLQPGSPTRKRDLIFQRLSHSSPALPINSVPREKNRLTLRSFLRQIVKDKRLAQSNAFVRFLLNDPIEKLSEDEEADIERRLEMDGLRLEEQKKFVEESRKRARELEQWLRGFKKELINNRTTVTVWG
jgi:hypothetical protein